MASHHQWILLLCLQTWLEAAGNHTDVFIINGTLGESVTFPLKILNPQQVTSIAWSSETSVAFVNPGDQGRPIVTVTHQNYDDRINVSGQNYNLIMSSLRMEDSGIYKVDINTKNDGKKTTITRKYNLQVYRRLGKPRITLSLMTSVNNTCNVTLSCSVDHDKNVTFQWSPLGEKGRIIQVFQSLGDPERTYTCTARNPISSSNDSVTALQLCTDGVLGTWKKRSKMLSMLALPALVACVLPLLLLWFLYKKGQCRLPRGSPLKTFSKKPDDDAEKTFYTYVTVMRDAQPTESRIYDEIPPTKIFSEEESVNTIYSNLQSSEKMEKPGSKDPKTAGTPSYEIVV
ncbi:SLAM family member 5 isoform X1 [Erinaceus europaeus]|uniref:SLAM family member 5 isoform X1 n=1 Tax=Erinaceus europaeus TaxID=9365 RepID=A0ABM3XXU2_ERIEU|nr:SLAM family member 5 isoform X1 [Erinaceus europaeus]